MSVRDIVIRNQTAARGGGVDRERFAVSGDTYPLRAELKLLGAVWNKSDKYWVLPQRAYVGVREMLAAHNVPVTDESDGANAVYYQHQAMHALIILQANQRQEFEKKLVEQQNRLLNALAAEEAKTKIQPKLENDRSRKKSSDEENDQTKQNISSHRGNRAPSRTNHVTKKKDVEENEDMPKSESEIERRRRGIPTHKPHRIVRDTNVDVNTGADASVDSGTDSGSDSDADTATSEKKEEDDAKARISRSSSTKREAAAVGTSRDMRNRNDRGGRDRTREVAEVVRGSEVKEVREKRVRRATSATDIKAVPALASIDFHLQKHVKGGGGHDIETLTFQFAHLFEKLKHLHADSDIETLRERVRRRFTQRLERTKRIEAAEWTEGDMRVLLEQYDNVFFDRRMLSALAERKVTLECECDSMDPCLGATDFGDGGSDDAVAKQLPLQTIAGSCVGSGTHECTYKLQFNRIIMQSMVEGSTYLCGGVPCTSSIECLQHTMEHGLVHTLISVYCPWVIVDMHANKGSKTISQYPCGPMFKRIVDHLFSGIKSKRSSKMRADESNTAR
jgi:hypothetical protein